MCESINEISLINTLSLIGTFFATTCFLSDICLLKSSKWINSKSTRLVQLVDGNSIGRNVATIALCYWHARTNCPLCFHRTLTLNQTLWMIEAQWRALCVNNKRNLSNTIHCVIDAPSVARMRWQRSLIGSFGKTITTFKSTNSIDYQFTFCFLEESSTGDEKYREICNYNIWYWACISVGSRIKILKAMEWMEQTMAAVKMSSEIWIFKFPISNVQWVELTECRSFFDKR